MSRIDLFVSPEDYPRVQALGACWDGYAKCWYIELATPDARFAPWLPDAAVADAADGVENDTFLIESSDACIARAITRCRRCRRDIEILCVYCRHGTVSGEPLEAFTVQCLWAVDDALRRQLQRWPTFRPDAREGIYLNHCPHCGAAQSEADLHEEPGQPFHELCREVPEGVRLEPLAGPVRLNGDYCVEA